MGAAACVLRCLDQELGLIDNWLRHVRSIYRRQPERFEGLMQEDKEDLLCELNVLDQTRHVEETSFVQNAWKMGQHLELHSWVYRLSDGLLHDLHFKPFLKERLKRGIAAVGESKTEAPPWLLTQRAQRWLTKAVLKLSWARRSV